MRVGVDGFCGERLKQALEFRILTKAALATKVGVSPSVLTKYLDGSRSPSPENFLKISAALGFPSQFFLKETKAEGYGKALKQWRSLVSAKKADRSKGEAVMHWMVEMHRYFNGIYDLPKPNLPELEGLPEDFREITDEDIEKAATELREHWELGKTPIRSLMRTAERAGFVVCRFNLNAEKLDAVSTVFDGIPFVLLNSCKQSGVRGRYDLAHEIGHIILHRSVQQEDLQGPKKEVKDIYNKLESQAHQFAGALLLPQQSFTNDFWAPTLSCFIDLKPKWKASIQAMMRRALDLELISETQFQYLNIAISKKKIRKSEPLDGDIPPEIPRLFPKCLEKTEEDLGFSGLQQFLSWSSVGERVTEEICSVRDGFFAGKETSSADDKIVIFERYLNDQGNQIE